MYVTSLFWVTYLIRPALIQNNPTSDSSDWLYYIDVCHVLILGHYLIRPALIQNNPTSDSSDWLYYIDVCHVLILGHVFDSSRSNTEQTYRMSYIPKYSN